MAKSVEGLRNCAVAYRHDGSFDVQEALERIDQIEAVHCWAASVSGDAPLNHKLRHWE